MPPPNLFRKSPTAARPIIVRRAGVHASIIRLSDNADRRANLRMRCHLKLGGEADANTPMSSPSGAPLKFMAAPKPWRRRNGATQYARLIGLSTAVSGILDAPLSRGMTAERHAPSSSRHNRVRVVDRPKAPSRKRAQGMPGEGLTHGPPANKNAGGRNHRFCRIIRHSLRGGFNAYGVLSPGTGLFCPRRRAIISRNLTSASGGQDHTLLRPLQCRSSARTSRARRQSVHRIPRSTYRDDRPKRPSSIEAGCADHASDLWESQVNF